jgi:hypothetical protein
MYMWICGSVSFLFPCTSVLEFWNNQWGLGIEIEQGCRNGLLSYIGRRIPGLLKSLKIPSLVTVFFPHLVAPAVKDFRPPLSPPSPEKSSQSALKNQNIADSCTAYTVENMSPTNLSCFFVSCYSRTHLKLFELFSINSLIYKASHKSCSCSALIHELYF